MLDDNDDEMFEWEYGLMFFWIVVLVREWYIGGGDFYF